MTYTMRQLIALEISKMESVEMLKSVMEGNSVSQLEAIV